jgi:dTDP-4-dehydrorhamnose 3,5-epimerase
MKRMQKIETAIPGLLLLKPRVFEDDRGWFTETYNEQAFVASGLPARFVQDNQSHSHRGVLRGLHYQLGEPQGKLVRVTKGRVFDAVVDLRPGSGTFGKWAGFELSDTDHTTLWIPENFAHGFLVLSEWADVLYKVTRPYNPATERTLRWNDPFIGIQWPCEGDPVLSAKDAEGRLWQDADLPTE